MTTTTSTELIIKIKDNEPQERKNFIIKAITAAIRWSAHTANKKRSQDDENVIVLSELLEELVND